MGGSSMIDQVQGRDEERVIYLDVIKSQSFSWILLAVMLANLVKERQQTNLKHAIQEVHG